ncbi:B-cell receptor-associated protein 31-like [Haliotis rufescens]|uniref:B-cell receptor-associated protein 31-like n=1 Tax=Haliotis rufescens TaxID=6454 RepID=UPI00201F6B94|nr:B-cell receptor-associated protein 31-like [Haliotis rufescens]
MTLQWTLTAGCLYVEIGVTVLLLCPWISPTLWQRLFRSRWLFVVTDYAKYYFWATVVVLIFVFRGSLLDNWKYSGSVRGQELKMSTETRMLAQSKMFRAQRNLYISGFVLLLAFVIGRLVVLLSANADMINRLKSREDTNMASNNAQQQQLRQSQSSTARRRITDTVEG